LETFDLKLEILLICDHVQENEYRHLIKASDRLSILTYRLKGKTGVAAARNLGLSKATGDYVYFLDSDDYLYDDTIAVLSQAALQQDADIIYGKKQNTWFGRSVFFTQEKETEDTEEDSGSLEEVLNSEDSSELDRERKDATETNEADKL
jgi:CDP-glycerol glycerophosphotransferase